MMKFRGIRQNKTAIDLFQVLSGNVVTQALGFLVLAAIARKIGPTEFGQFALFVSLFAILTQVIDLGFSTSIVKHGSDLLSRGGNFVGYVEAVTKLRLFLSVTTALCIIYFSEKISVIVFGSNQKVTVITTVALSLPFCAIYFTILSCYQACQKFKVYTLFNVVAQLIRSVLFVVVVYWCALDDITLLALVYLSPIFIITSAYCVFNARFLTYSSSEFREVRESLRVGVWAFISAVFAALIMRVDIILLQKLSVATEVGHYSAAVHFAMVFPLITSALVTTLLPKSAAYINQNSISRYSKKIYSSGKYVLLLIVLAVMCAPPVVSIFLGEQYEPAIAPLRILLFAYGLGAIINPLILIFYVKNAGYLISVGLAIQLIINIIASFILIPQYHAIGASVAALVGRCASFVIYGYLIVRLERESA